MTTKISKKARTLGDCATGRHDHPSDVGFLALSTYKNVEGPVRNDRASIRSAGSCAEEETASLPPKTCRIDDILSQLDHLDQVDLLLPAQRCTWRNHDAIFDTFTRRFPGDAPIFRLHILEEGEAVYWSWGRTTK